MGNDITIIEQDVHVNRDLSVGRNVIMGGDEIVRGNMQVDHGLVVKGWLKAENVNFPTAGVFASVSDLNTAYPAPQKPGLIAGVLLDTTPASVELYYSQAGDTPWVDSGKTMDVRTILSITTEGVDAEALEALEQDIEALDSAKADKVTTFTANNFAALDASGNLKDSGHKHSDYAAADHSHSGYANKVGSGHSKNIAMFTIDGDLEDSGKRVTLLDLLKVQTCYFKGVIPSGADVQMSRLNEDVDPADYVNCIYIVEGAPSFFVCYDNTTQKYYAKWGDDGENAYMTSAGTIKKNKLYIDSTGKAFYCDNGNNLKSIKIDDDNYATKVHNGTQGNFPILDADGNIANSQYSHSSFAAADHTHSSYANKSEMDVDDTDGEQVITLKGIGAAATKARAYTPELSDILLGLPVGETVRVTFDVDDDGDYSFIGNGFDDKGLRLIVINGVGYRKGFSSITVEANSSLTVDYVFEDPSAIPYCAFAEFDGDNGRLKLTAVHIPSFVHSIGDKAFGGCDKLVAIDCEAMTPPSLEKSSFSGIDMSTVELTVHHVAKTLYDDGSTTWAGVGSVLEY